MLKNLLSGRYNASIHQLSILVWLPLLYTQFGAWAFLLTLVFALQYQFFSISLTGHMLIGHRRSLGKYVDYFFYLLFFYTTFVTPAVWGAFHAQHHKYHDTEKDPQSAKHYGLRVLLFALWNPDLLDKRTFLVLCKNPLIGFIEKHYWLMFALGAIPFVLFPWEYVLLFWLAPTSMCVSLATYSAYYSHKEGHPYEEFNTLHRVLIAGEHKQHADHHKDTRVNTFENYLK